MKLGDGNEVVGYEFRRGVVHGIAWFMKYALSAQQSEIDDMAGKLWEALNRKVPHDDPGIAMATEAISAALADMPEPDGYVLTVPRRDDE